MTLQTDKLMEDGWDNNTEESASKRDKMAGLYDKNSDKLYAPKQLLPQSDYDMEDKKNDMECMGKKGNYWIEQEKELSEKLSSLR